MSDRFERHWDDIGYSAVASFDPQYPTTHVKLQVFKIVATEIDGRAGSRGYERIGANSSLEFVETFDGAAVYLAGAVKWDGCSNWSFDNDGTELHFCDADQAANIGELFRRLYAWAKELGMDRL